MSHGRFFFTRLLAPLLLLHFSSSAWAQGESEWEEKENPSRGSEVPSHFFNAGQLRKGSYQISALSQLRWGVTDELELSTLGFAYVIRPTLFNLGLKHQMFKTERAITSFNVHTFLFRSGEDLWLISLHGVVSSIAMGASQHKLNLGLMDGLIMTFASDAQTSLHLLTPMVGWDWKASGSWSLSAMFARPIYAIGQLESDVNGEGNLEIDFTRKNYNPGLGFLTASYAWTRARIEFGALYLSIDKGGQLAPYLNFFWSFGAHD